MSQQAGKTVYGVGESVLTARGRVGMGLGSVSPNSPDMRWYEVGECLCAQLPGQEGVLGWGMCLNSQG